MVPLLSRRIVFCLLLTLSFFSSCHRPVQEEKDVTVFQTQSFLLSELNSPDNAVVTGDFTIKNIAPEERSWTYAGADCFCVGVFHEERKLEGTETFTFGPGQEKSFQLKTNVPHQPGPWNYSAAFKDQENGQIILLKIAGQNYSDLTIKPSSLIGNFTSDSPKSFQETVRLTRTVRGVNLPTLPKPIVSELPPFMKLLDVTEISQCKKLDEGIYSQSWECEFEIRDDGTLMGNTPAQTVLIAFPATESLAEIIKPITLLIRRKIGIDAPDHSSFGFCLLNHTNTRRILIRSADDKSYKILNCETDSDFFSAQVAEVTEDENHISHWLDLTFTPKTSGEHAGILTIETDHPDAPQVRISLHGNGKE